MAWLAVGMIFILMACEPISIEAQFTLGLSAVLVMATIKLLNLRGVWRQIFIAMGTCVVIRYYYWRTTSTLPPISDLADFIPGVLLWIAEVYSGMMLAISLFVIADPLERQPAPRIPASRLPTVDVFVPTYNEDREMLAVTVAAASMMDYPAEKLRVHLLDDGGTDQKCNQENPRGAKAARERRADLTRLAQELGASYWTRAKNVHAKAGNMNSALQQTQGDLIAVFDADHVPTRDFLMETVGYFVEDPRMFLVQTPHFFANPDPLEKNLETFAKMPSENEMFYGVIQKGLDKWNAAFFCGSAAVIRREALAEVGGFSGISITEDCETALDLHSRGWNSLYCDKPMISGLQPETFASFIGQRSRWCRGMFQIFLLKNPALKKGLSPTQKVAYLSNMTYWFFPVFRLPFIISPLLYIWFSMQIYIANSHEFVAYTILYMSANMMMQNYLFGTVRWPWVSELYEFVQSIFLSRGLFSVILNPRKPTFNVTDKGQSLEQDHLSELSTSYIVIYGIIAASAAFAAWRYFTEPGANELLVVVSIWNTFNLLLSGASLGVVSERRTPRVMISRKAELAIGPVIVPGTITDVSTGGIRVRLEDGAVPAHLGTGTPGIVSLDLKNGEGQRTLPVLISNRLAEDGMQSIGFEFPPLKAQHYRTLVDLMYPDSAGLEAFRSGRRKQKSVLGGMGGFIWWGLSEPFHYFKTLRDVMKRRAQDAKSLTKAAQTAGEPVQPAEIPILPERANAAQGVPAPEAVLPMAVGQ